MAIIERGDIKESSNNFISLSLIMFEHFRNVIDYALFDSLSKIIEKSHFLQPKHLQCGRDLAYVCCNRNG